MAEKIQTGSGQVLPSEHKGSGIYLDRYQRQDITK